MIENPFSRNKPLSEALKLVGRRLLGSAKLNETKKGVPHKVDTTPFGVPMMLHPQELEVQQPKKSNIKVVTENERAAAAAIWQELLAMDNLTSGDEAEAPDNDLLLGNRAYQLEGKSVYTGVQQKLGDMRPWNKQG